jgi:hypothetical protein
LPVESDWQKISPRGAIYSKNWLWSAAQNSPSLN